MQDRREPEEIVRSLDLRGSAGIRIIKNHLPPPSLTPPAHGVCWGPAAPTAVGRQCAAHVRLVQGAGEKGGWETAVSVLVLLLLVLKCCTRRGTCCGRCEAGMTARHGGFWTRGVHAWPPEGRWPPPHPLPPLPAAKHPVRRVEANPPPRRTPRRHPASTGCFTSCLSLCRAGPC